MKKRFIMTFTKSLVLWTVFFAITFVSCFDDYKLDDYKITGEDYTITFNANGGTGNVPSPMRVHAEFVVAFFTLPDTDLSKDGNSFVGWRDPDSSIAYYNKPGRSYSVTEDTELIAVYENDSDIYVPPYVPPGEGTGNSGLYVTATGNKYHKYGHMGATIPLSQGKNGPYTACQICF
jgi:hypothetical protein